MANYAIVIYIEIGYQWRDVERMNNKGLLMMDNGGLTEHRRAEGSKPGFRIATLLANLEEIASQVVE